MEFLGLVSGFLLGSFGLVGGRYVIATKDSAAANIAGTVITGGSFYALVSVFVIGKRRQTHSEDD